MTVSVDAETVGAAIPDEFVGLSFEMESLFPDDQGKYYFHKENQPLIALFAVLGIKSLRVGGNTADRPNVPVPSGSDIDNLFEFARAAGVKVIYTLRLRKGDPEVAAQIAKYIMDHYRSDLACFAIGNEPNVFTQDYSVYRDEWRKYIELITSPEYAPSARFCGPSSTPGKAEWCRDFARDFGSSGRIAFIAQHAYPGGSGRRVIDPVAGREVMLSESWVKSYESFYESFVPTVSGLGLTYRIEETNNYFHGGAVDVSNTFAAALWGLDYMYWWASHGAIGLNFHTGDSVAAADATTPCQYASFTISTGGYKVHPIGYAIKAFGLGAHGNLVPLRISSNTEGIALTAYATKADDGTLYVTLISKETGPHPRDVNVTIVPAASFARAEVISLTSPDKNLAGTSGVTLGGAEIKEDASWSGSWTTLGNSSGKGEYTIFVSAVSANVVRLSVR